MGEHAPFDPLLDAARAGDEAAWSSLYHTYAPKVLGYLRARGAPDPEDLLGEVFLQVVRDLPGFVGREPEFRSWLFTVAHNRLLDAARYRSRRPEPDPLPDDDAAGMPAGDAEAEAVELVETDRLRRMIGTLTPDQQTVLFLRLFADLSIPQIASLMGRAVPAVKMLQRRGLAALRTALDEERSLSSRAAATRGER